tara:strand:+ start:218 stop:364 length:147 start_codon:yes stop_codon:yes gene_type:complete
MKVVTKKKAKEYQKIALDLGKILAGLKNQSNNCMLRLTKTRITSGDSP